jgi:ketopantoate reductase
MVRGGESVLFVDKGLDHVRAVQTRGLTIRGFAETFTVPVDATEPDALPDRLETVLLACKAPATDDAVRSFADRLAPDGCVVRDGADQRLYGRMQSIGTAT